MRRLLERYIPYSKGLNRTEFGFYLITLGAVLVILCITLYPFRFEQFGRIASVHQYVDGFGADEYSRCCKHLIYLEPLANIMLFIPFGFGLAGLGVRKLHIEMHPLLAVSLAALLLSLFVEFFQVFQPNRSPSLQDLLMNTIGGAAGYGVFPAVEEICCWRTDSQGAFRQLTLFVAKTSFYT